MEKLIMEGYCSLTDQTSTPDQKEHNNDTTSLLLASASLPQLQCNQ